MKKALIMEGGAMRGLFTCGVLDVFMENGITFDGASGVSAGAAFGCNIKSHQIGRALRYNKKYAKDKRMGNLWSWVTTGDLYNVPFAYHELPYVLDPFDFDTFEQDPMEFWVPATDVETGEAVFHLCTDGREEDIEWIRASSSIPMLSRIVELDGKKLLDGGTAVPVPYHFMMEEQGYDKSVTILTQPEGFVKKPLKYMPLLAAWYRKYPNLVKALANRHDRYNALYFQIEQDARAGRTFIIRPPESLNVGSAENDPAELDRVYRAGRLVALDQLQKVGKFLEE